MKYPSRSLVPDVLQTERLVLRMFRDEDWRQLHEYYSDPESTKFTYRRALSDVESWLAMAGMIGHWQLRGYGPYAVEEKSSGNVLGTVGPWYPTGWPEPEIKWALTRRYWGKGYASEAARAVQQMARKHMPRVSLISFIHSENEPSIALALAVGATFEKELEFRGGKWHIYRHPR